MEPQYNKVQWYHCLIPSFFLHVILLCLVYFDVLGLDLHIFSLDRKFNTYQIPQIPSFQWVTTAVILPEIPNEQPESVSPEENVFESVEEETPIPEFHFSTKEDEPVTPDEPETIVKPSHSDIHSTAPIVSETSNAEPVNSELPALSQGSGSGTAPVQSHLPSSNTNSTTTHNQIITKPNPAPPDLAVMAWKQYTQKLSKHFKSHKFYPEMARRLQLSGTVKISVQISREGKILSVSIAESSGNAILDQAALQSAKSADPVPPFPPETTDDTKMVTIPYHYSLK